MKYKEVMCLNLTQEERDQLANEFGHLLYEDETHDKSTEIFKVDKWHHVYLNEDGVLLLVNQAALINGLTVGFEEFQLMPKYRFNDFLTHLINSNLAKESSASV